MIRLHGLLGHWYATLSYLYTLGVGLYLLLSTGSLHDGSYQINMKRIKEKGMGRKRNKIKK